MLPKAKSQHYVTFGMGLCCLCSLLVLTAAGPLPANKPELDVLQIPLSNGKELDVLTLSGANEEQLIAERNKRTVGLLRDLFPDITKEIDSIVNRIIAQVIRVAGPGVLNSLLNNRGGGGGAGGAGRGPTTSRSDFDAAFDDDDDDDNDDDNDNNNASVSGGTARVKIDLPTFAPDSDTAGAAPAAIMARTTTTTTQATAAAEAINKR